MKFKYHAKTKEGETKMGQIEAFSKEAAIEILQRHSLYPIFVEEEVEIPLYKKIFLFFKKVSTQDIVAASKQLSILFKSGVPIVEALNSVAKEAKNSILKETFYALAREIESGNNLSTALSRYPDIFSDVYISMVKTGEVSGELAKSLETIAETMEKNYFFASKIKNALIYPAIVFFMGLLILFLVFFYLVPKLTLFVTEVGTEFPPSLKLLINISGFLKEWGIVISSIFIIIVIVLFLYMKTLQGKQNLQRLLLSLPIIGNFLKIIYVSRIATNLTILMSGGVPIGEAIEATEEITGNVVYKKILTVARDAVRSGESISNFFKDYPTLFPSFFAQMIATGEKTGSLTKTLSQVSNFYEQEIERVATNLTTFLTPILIVILGGTVGLILFVILMTIYQTITLF